MKQEDMARVETGQPYVTVRAACIFEEDLPRLAWAYLESGAQKNASAGSKSTRISVALNPSNIL